MFAFYINLSYFLIPMKIKTSSDLVKNALEEIETISPNDAKKLNNDKICNLIDIRDIRELNRDGKISGALHIPRGMLEFWFDPTSPFFKEGKIDPRKTIVLFCAAGMRSALAAKTLQDMGFQKVAHINGGFQAMKQEGFEIEKE